MSLGLVFHLEEGVIGAIKGQKVSLGLVIGSKKGKGPLGLVLGFTGQTGQTVSLRLK